MFLKERLLLIILLAITAKPFNTEEIQFVLRRTYCKFGYVSNGSKCEDCGLSYVKRNVRIVGGIDAEPNSWPSHVLIKQSIKLDYKLRNGTVSTLSKVTICGGTLLNHYTVLTAAHCITTSVTETLPNREQIKLHVKPNEYYPTLESMFQVFMGMHDKFYYNEPNVPRSIKQIIKHPEYDSSSFWHDIALIILSHPVQYNKRVQPACLPQEGNINYPVLDRECYAVGWGSIVENGFSVAILQNVKIQALIPSFCSNATFGKKFNFSSQICAGNIVGGKDTCQGDSGGGLYTIEKSGGRSRHVVSGIVSYGIGCGRKHSPGVYTKVSYYRNWIHKHWVLNAATGQNIINIISIKFLVMLQCIVNFI